MRPAYLWDYDLDEETFREILAGHRQHGSLDRDWAAVRLLEYASYREIVDLLGFRQIVEGWPKWRRQIRSESRRRGFDFLAAWLPEHHPELMAVPPASAHYDAAQEDDFVVDEDLLARAHRVTGLADKTATVHAGLEALIARASARRLAALGGSERTLHRTPRRRHPAARHERKRP